MCLSCLLICCSSLILRHFQQSLDFSSIIKVFYQFSSSAEYSQSFRKFSYYDTTVVILYVCSFPLNSRVLLTWLPHRQSPPRYCPSSRCTYDTCTTHRARRHRHTPTGDGNHFLIQTVKLSKLWWFNLDINAQWRNVYVFEYVSHVCFGVEWYINCSPFLSLTIPKDV
jgi:hypothetical protein